MPATLRLPRCPPRCACPAHPVTDTGGLLSHPAIIAREFGVPAVVGTGDATERLQDGQLVTIDGSAGTVTLVAGG